MKREKEKSGIKRAILFLAGIFILAVIFLSAFIKADYAEAFPFYGLKDKGFTLRAEFSTTYQKSSEERKHNIALATKSINKTFLDVDEEFSFNKTVGLRVESRGYKKAKIISKGVFTEGVGGGVCQVSTTLYNAVLLSGLDIREKHAHSLPVSYVEPSFDAMVNSGSSDLKFVNNTGGPIVLFAHADGKKITVSVYGEKSEVKIVRKSVVTGKIPVPEAEVIIDEKGEYKDLFEGEKRVLRYGSEGLTSVGYIAKIVNGRQTGVIKIREDRYAATKGLVVVGTTKREEILEGIQEQKFKTYKKIL